MVAWGGLEPPPRIPSPRGAGKEDMTADAYKRLAEHLDPLPNGFSSGRASSPRREIPQTLGCGASPHSVCTLPGGRKA